jgi:hypothetical protein
VTSSLLALLNGFLFSVLLSAWLFKLELLLFSLAISLSIAIREVYSRLASRFGSTKAGARLTVSYLGLMLGFFGGECSSFSSGISSIALAVPLPRLV